LLVNEGLPWVEAEQQPLSVRYEDQLKTSGIPEWSPAAE
jgi:hypothetical protein